MALDRVGAQMTSEPSKKEELASATVGGVGGGTIGVVATALLGPFGALLGSLSSPLLTEGARKVFERRSRRAEAAAQEAADAANIPFQDLVEMATDDDRRLEIVGRALQAAAMSEDAVKIRALGRSMAAGVLTTDDAKVDETLRIIDALADLEPADVKVLARMRQHSGWWDVRPSDGRPNPPTIVQNMPEVETVVDSIIARLSTLGAITRPDSGAQTWGAMSSWFVTDFGCLCLDTLLAAGKSSGQTDEKAGPRRQ